jgi:type II secretory pathway component GspD/PulD (secretin)
MTHQATHRALAVFFSLTLAVVSLSLTARAQDKPADEKPAPAQPYKPWTDYAAELHTTNCDKMPNRTARTDCAMANSQTRFIYLKNVTAQNDANEVLVALRNSLDPSTKIYLVASQNAIALTTYPEEFARAEAIVRGLDLPHKAYRLTYTIVESDAGKRIGIQHFSMVVVAGQRTTLKQGSKVPVATGSYITSDKTSQEQFTYLDVGMNFDATLIQTGDNLVLKNKVEQSSIADVRNSLSDRDPVVRQSVMEGFANLTPGKPATIGAIDVPGSTRHLDIEALAELLP